jgi:hypothetical protein
MCGDGYLEKSASNFPLPLAGPAELFFVTLPPLSQPRRQVFPSSHFLNRV